MKEKVKDLWVEALRSGEYKQGHCKLKDNDKYCCLGVLCDVYAKNQKKKGFQSEDGISSFIKDIQTKEKCTAGLPTQVKKWAGVKDSMGRFNKVAMPPLYDLNDSQEYTFDQIANVIELYYLDLV